MEDTDLYDLALILFGVCMYVVRRLPSSCLTRSGDSWDYFTSLWFEYRLLTKKIVFRWEFASGFSRAFGEEGRCADAFFFFIRRFRIFSLDTRIWVTPYFGMPPKWARVCLRSLTLFLQSRGP